MNEDETNVSSLPRGKNSTWYWLKSSSGRRNNIHTIAIKQEEEESSAAAAIPDEIASMANCTNDDDDDDHENRRRNRELRNLAPHNNVGTTEAFPMPPKRARKPPTLFIHNYAGSGDRDESSISIQREDEDLRDVAVPDSIPSSLPSDLVEWEKRRAANTPEPVGWYWHLNPDGSPLVVDAAGRKRLSKVRNGKRKTKRRPGPSNTQLPANEGSKDFNPSAKRPRRARAPIVDYRESGDEEEESTEGNEEESAFGDDNEAAVDEEEDLQACQGGVRGNNRGCLGRYSNDPKRWEKQFQRLVEYKNKHGNTNVPASDRTLGNWVKKQRRSYKQKKLLQYRMERLVSDATLDLVEGSNYYQQQ